MLVQARPHVHHLVLPVRVCSNGPYVYRHVGAWLRHREVIVAKARKP